MKRFIFAFVLSLLGTISLVTASSDSLISSSTSSLSFPFSANITTASSSLFTLTTSTVNLPTQSYDINIERPKMINRINTQRSGMGQTLICQDSLLTSIAQQHANDMAVLDTLAHNLPCNTNAFPTQFCKSSQRLAPYGSAAENIIALTGNDGSASAAMAQFNADATSFSNMMSPNFLYIGVGMAMNQISGKYYWVQVFSHGDYQGVSCTMSPTVTVLDAFNSTTTTVQPTTGLKCGLYPKGIKADATMTNGNGVENLYCTMIPFAHGPSGSALPLGQLPYPTITILPPNITSALGVKASSIIGVFQSALAQVNASIVGPSSLSLFPNMQVVPTTTSISTSTSITSSSGTDSSVTTNSSGSSSSSTTTSPSSSTSTSPSSFSFSYSTFSPTNSAQSSAFAAISSMMTNPTMSSAMIQMAQQMMMASSSPASSSSFSSSRN